MPRFANAGSYVHHMTTHKFHQGHNPRLPPLSARKGRVLPKISKKEKKKKQEKKFANKEKTLKFCERKELKEKQEEESWLRKAHQRIWEGKKNESVG